MNHVPIMQMKFLCYTFLSNANTTVTYDVVFICRAPHLISLS